MDSQNGLLKPLSLWTEIFGDGSIMFNDETEEVRFYSFLQRWRSTKVVLRDTLSGRSLFVWGRTNGESREEEKRSDERWIADWLKN